ncbi:class I SAM-dependent methyltransferase [Rhodococcus sp. H36-A4]|uniref:class I SAM-dependent methyltransferase n=1 Tax=Rhodococcus sp. H36-A4 TaxID=3004353 RepID=UPI0022AEEC29|nr:class I SAM-dependent methyltransferase [Rhodococcus sp. H36-A4]MCZ4077100.1 class I SAM-dependent methyltransferase [Rhodococcus sp. H36-A4]
MPRPQGRFASSRRVERPVTRFFAQRATLRRSVSLLRDFGHEQSAPDIFYSALARDSVELIGDLYQGLTGDSLEDRMVMDVGGGPGYFADVFRSSGARYIPVEPDPTEMHAAGLTVHGSVRGSGMALPFRDDSVDVCFSSNVAEHVRHPWVMAEEMLRVTKPGGLMVLSYTLWRGPFGGHETGPWHYFGGEFAARRYLRKHGREPKNRFGESLFDVGASEGLRWARETTQGTVLAAFPRYHPKWAWWMIRVPVLREFLASNLVVVLRADAR